MDKNMSPEEKKFTLEEIMAEAEAKRAAKRTADPEAPAVTTAPADSDVPQTVTPAAPPVSRPTTHTTANIIPPAEPEAQAEPDPQAEPEPDTAQPAEIIPDPSADAAEPAEAPRRSLSDPDHPVSDHIPDCAKPDVHEEHHVGEGMSKKEAMRIRMKNMNKQEIAYLRRKQIFEKCWPVFRFLILFGLGFVILTPLMFMLSYGFRENADMNDPTIIWIPRHLTLRIMKQTINAMGLTRANNNPLINTLVLNIGCSICQVVTCAITGYGFARFKFKGRNLLFGIVVLMILVPTQIISIPLYSTFRNFLFGTVNLIDNMLVMYLPALTANGIRAGLMIFIFRQFFRGLPKELEDAAYLDGCGPFKTFIKVMVPNAASSFLTVFLFSIVWYWNDYYVASSFFTNTKTISLVLKNLDGILNIEIFNNANANISAREKIVWLEAGCLISITPMLILYACLQKHFTEGIERSGIVG